MGHGTADAGQPTPHSTFYDQGRFGRLFPTLPPFAADTPSMRAALAELGAAGGLMDAEDNVADPIALITNPALSAKNNNNSAMTAGETFLGQFLDHDMTFDPTSASPADRTPSRSATSGSRRSTSTASTAAAPAPRRTSTTRRSTAAVRRC
jgi:hypothetical protein